MERALHLASQILPRIQAYNFPYNRFPTTRGWVEKRRREDLPAYAAAEPSDIQQFLSIDEAAFSESDLNRACGETASLLSRLILCNGAHAGKCQNRGRQPA